MRYYKFSYMNNVIHEKDGVIFFDYESQMLCKLNFTTKEMLFEAHNSGGRIQISNIFKLSNQIVIMPWIFFSASTFVTRSSTAHRTVQTQNIIITVSLRPVRCALYAA